MNINKEAHDIYSPETGKFDLYEFHRRFNHNILMSYKGPFDNHILASLGGYIKAIMRRNQRVSRKLFNIYIEAAQNISFYSAEKNSLSEENVGIGAMIIGETESQYFFVTGNAVRNDVVQQLLTKCELINSLDREALRQYKHEQRKLPAGDRGNAHIGLIQIALTSDNPLDIEITAIDDATSFFALTVKIEKD